jgi:hypothetical protein
VSVTTVNFPFLQNHDPSLLKLAALVDGQPEETSEEAEENSGTKPR